MALMTVLSVMALMTVLSVMASMTVVSDGLGDCVDSDGVDVFDVCWTLVVPTSVHFSRGFTIFFQVQILGRSCGS
jgi:hypothetical protein